MKCDKTQNATKQRNFLSKMLWIFHKCCGDSGDGGFFQLWQVHRMFTTAAFPPFYGAVNFGSVTLCECGLDQLGPLCAQVADLLRDFQCSDLARQPTEQSIKQLKLVPLFNIEI